MHKRRTTVNRRQISILGHKELGITFDKQMLGFDIPWPYNDLFSDIPSKPLTMLLRLPL